MSLTFIAAYRDRDTERVRRSLDSLKDQTCQNFEMVLVDYGSQMPSSSRIQQLVTGYPFCRYIYSDTRGWPWNRSAGLNTGARVSRGNVLFLTDVDIIYPPQFVERILKHQGSDVFFASACFRSPKGFRQWELLARDGFSGSWPEMKGKGLMCCPRQALEAVGGLDEKFAYWGAEDHDFAERLARFGLKELNLPEIHCYHQWHPHLIYQLPLSVQFNNLTRYHGGKSGGRIRANEHRDWGRVVRREERPIYQFVDPEHGVPRSGMPVQSIEAFGIANVLTAIREIAAVGNVLWALPRYNASDTDATFLNKVLRRCGWRLDRRLGYVGDVAQGLLLSVPGLFRDCYLTGSNNGRACTLFLT